MSIDDKNAEVDVDFDVGIDADDGAGDSFDGGDDSFVDADGDGGDGGDGEMDGESEAGDTEVSDATASVYKSSIGHINRAYNKLLPITILAAIIGLCFGILVVVAGVLLNGKVNFMFFIATPLFIYFFNALLGGGRDIRALIVFTIFSLASIYLSLIAGQSAFYPYYLNYPISTIPSVFVQLFGRLDTLPTVASAYVYTSVFTVMGVAVSAELLRRPPRLHGKHKKALPEADDTEDVVENS
ncbi:MAG: hypothetical protein FWH33_02850 [Oscillospiraceae bacterium]|nr:hypothetical protein [Oscillospiraceae bacterium]